MQRVSHERRESEEEKEEEECSLEVLPLTSSKLQAQKLVATQASMKATPSKLSLHRACKTNNTKTPCTYNKQRQTSRHYQNECEEELHKCKEEWQEAERWEYLWSCMESRHLQIPAFCCASLICYRDRYLVLFGGASSNTNAYHGLYVYDLDCQSWLQPCVQNENIATPRACHSSILVEEEDVMLVYGGKDLVNDICYDEVLELNLLEWRWRIRSRAPPPPNGPGERWQHSAHYYDKKMFVLMGKGDGTHELFTTDMLMPETTTTTTTLESSFAYECMVWYLDLTTDRWHAVLTRPYLPITISLNDTSEEITTSKKNDLHSTCISMSSNSSSNNNNARNTSMLNLTNRHTSYTYFGRPTMSLQNHAAVLDGSFVYVFGGLLVSSESGRNAQLQFDRLNVAQEANSAVNNYYNNDLEFSLNAHSGHERWLYSNKLYRYHLPTNTWSEIIITPAEPNTSTTTSQPAPRYAATLTVINHILYLFGGDANGTKANNYFGDLWMLQLPPESTHWQSAYRNYTNATSTLYKAQWVELKRDKSRAILAQSRKTEIQRDYMNNNKPSRRMHVTPEELSNVLHASSAFNEDHGSNFTNSYRTNYQVHNNINNNHANNIAFGHCEHNSVNNNNNDVISTSYYSNRYKNHFTWTEEHEQEEKNIDDGGNSLLCSRPQARSGHVCVLARGCLFVCGGEMPSCDSSNGPRYSASSNTLANNNNFITNRNTSDRMVAYDNNLYRYPLGLYTTLSLKDNVCRWLSRSKENQTFYALHLYNWNKCNRDDCGDDLLPINVEKLLNEYYTNR